MRKQIWLAFLALLFAVGSVSADNDENENEGGSSGTSTGTSQSTSSSTTSTSESTPNNGNGNGNGNGQEMITLCHVVPKTPHSITVADPAKVQAHLDHGDTVGGCNNEMAAPAAGIGSVITLCSQHGGGTGHQLTVSPVGRVSHIRITCD